MKIVTWNCNGAFRKKFEKISELDADIYVIQECEDPARAIQLSYQKWAKNYLWIGENKNKGLGIFAREGTELKPLDWSNQYKDHTVKYFLPCSVDQNFKLLAVLTHQNNSPNFGYMGQFWKYLMTNREKINDSMIVGDFNSNSIWDQWDRWWNHSDVVRELQELDIESFYHHFFCEAQGKESQPTLFFRKSRERFYHIDYIFGPKRFLPTILNVGIGKHEDWIVHSDHLPLFCEFSLPVND